MKRKKEKEKDKGNKTFNFRYRKTDVPVQDFVFPDDLETFILRQIEKKLKRISFSLVKRLEKRRQSKSRKTRLLAKYVG